MRIMKMVYERISNSLRWLEYERFFCTTTMPRENQFESTVKLFRFLTRKKGRIVNLYWLILTHSSLKRILFSKDLEEINETFITEK